MVFGLWSYISTASAQDSLRSEAIELVPIDSTQKTKEPFFTVMTKEGNKRRDNFKIDVSINNVYYNSFEVGDYATIALPATIKPSDLITIEKKTKKGLRQGWYSFVIKQSEGRE